MDLYAENILDHYRHPRKTGSMNDASVTHEEKNHSCGDAVMLHLKIDNNHIMDVSWTGEGCAISQAAMSMLAEELAGKSLNDADAITEESIRTMLGVPVGTRRLKCALLCLHTLKNALRIHRGEAAQTWNETVGQEN